MSLAVSWLEAHKDDLVETFKKIHAAPELGNQEYNTAALLADELRRSGYAVQEKVAGATGVIGTLKGPEPGPVLGLRADMDALPMTEDSGLPYASCIPGVAHTCGHDANASMVLYAAKALAQAGIARGEIRIIFQPAEELLCGALPIVRSGAAAGIDALVGVHLRPQYEMRIGQATPALMNGAARSITFTIKGVASHGARPHLGVNTVDIGVQIINAIRAIPIDSTMPHSATPTRFISQGNAKNIVPAETLLTIDMRARYNATIEDYCAKVLRVAQTVAEASGGSLETQVSGVPAAQLDGAVVEDLRKAIVEELGEALPGIYITGAEDFHLFAIEGGIRTAFLGVGADLVPDTHKTDMRFNLEALGIGAKILARFLENTLCKVK